MNPEQRKAMQIITIILCCFGIYTYTAIFTPVIHYCDYTHLEIQNRIGHEVTFSFHNGTTTHYCCVNISLLAFPDLIDADLLDTLDKMNINSIFVEKMRKKLHQDNNHSVYKKRKQCRDKIKAL